MIQINPLESPTTATHVTTPNPTPLPSLTRNTAAVPMDQQSVSFFLPSSQQLTLITQRTKPLLHFITYPISSHNTFILRSPTTIPISHFRIHRSASTLLPLFNIYILFFFFPFFSLLFPSFLPSLLSTNPLYPLLHPSTHSL